MKIKEHHLYHTHQQSRKRRRSTNPRIVKNLLSHFLHCSQVQELQEEHQDTKMFESSHQVVKRTSPTIVAPNMKKICGEVETATIPNLKKV